MILSPAARNIWRESLLNEPIGQFGSIFLIRKFQTWGPQYVKFFLSGVPDFFDRNKILSGGDLSHYQVPHCIRVFFYFVWFVFIHHNFQFILNYVPIVAF